MKAVASKAATKRPPQAEGLRQAMSWLHTWSGLIFGWLLFAMFLTGTLAFFRPEITRWMQPEIHTQAVPSAQAVEVAERYLREHAPDAARWSISVPTDREPWISVSYPVPNPPPGQRGVKRVRLDPVSGQAIAARQTRGGDFFYRFHFELEMGFPWGRWLASIAGMFMLVAIISGVITHKKIFTDFFTFRPRKGGQRAWMDGHNALSVLGLPFHLMITFSGLVLFMAMLMPAGILAAYDNQRAYFDDLFPASAVMPAQKKAAPLTPLAPLVEQAQTLWPGGQVGRLTVHHPGDAGATVTVTRSTADGVSYGRVAPSASFDGVTGEMRGAREAESAAMTTAGTIMGLHLGLFAQPLLRWFYFLVSLAGTAMVGTGLVLWVAKRRQKLPAGRGDTFSLRVIDALNAGTIAGVFLGVAVVFLANRLLPLDLPERQFWESRSFFIVWGLSLLYAFARPRTKWRDLMSLAALAFLLVPVVNALTTQRHLGVSLLEGDWVMAGFDLTCLAAGLLLGWIGMRKRKAVAPRRKATPAHLEKQALEGQA
ncbi:peptidase [Bordetella avium]|uniref:PepSY-associated TM helix domain-containing protein n=1 Tax=Bordetella avium TaxID=521 RepID=UPI000FD82C09|nr:PepSY-associated TM helix domain-containing protein [Bordetella avium]AZY48698.1 peptidase [Bordetella avium]